MDGSPIGTVGRLITRNHFGATAPLIALSIKDPLRERTVANGRVYFGPTIRR